MRRKIRRKRGPVVSKKITVDGITVPKLEKNLWNFPDQIAREIACDQFLQSVETNEAGEIISEDEKDKEDPLFDF